jgi:hypothetical protein
MTVGYVLYSLHDYPTHYYVVLDVVPNNSFWVVSTHGFPAHVFLIQVKELRF